MIIAEFALERYLAKHEFSAQYLLCTSDCETVSVRELLALEDGSSESFLDLRLGYTQSQGSPALREEISGWYTSLSPDQIVVTTGAEETIFIAMQVLLSPGDHVIVQTPAYQSLTELPHSLGCTVTPWALTEKGGRWVLDPDLLTDLIRPGTRMLVVNSPHNPTGHIFSHDEWIQIRDICSEHDIRILSDEVYRGSEHLSSLRLPAMADMYEYGYSIGVMSKALGLAGLRIGWIASQDRDFISRFLAFKDYTTICNSSTSEFLATVALRQKDSILARNNQIIKENLSSLDSFFHRYGDIVSWSRPQAGSTAFPRIVSDEPGDIFCEKVLENAGILLLPGSVFGVATPHFRIGYGRADFSSNLIQFEKYLNSLS